MLLFVIKILSSKLVFTHFANNSNSCTIAGKMLFQFFLGKESLVGATFNWTLEFLCVFNNMLNQGFVSDGFIKTLMLEGKAVNNVSQESTNWLSLQFFAFAFLVATCFWFSLILSIFLDLFLFHFSLFLLFTFSFLFNLFISFFFLFLLNLLINFFFNNWLRFFILNQIVAEITVQSVA